MTRVEDRGGQRRDGELAESFNFKVAKHQAQQCRRTEKAEEAEIEERGGRPAGQQVHAGGAPATETIYTFYITAASSGAGAAATA